MRWGVKVRCAVDELVHYETHYVIHYVMRYVMHYVIHYVMHDSPAVDELLLTTY